MTTDPGRKRLDTPDPQKSARRQPQTESEILDQIVEEFTERLRNGEFPSIGEYQEKYPGLEDEIDDVLASVALIEQLKSDNTSQPSRKSLFKQVEDLTQIGDYNIIREVGRGGMGVVFEAIHASLGRRVAIKVMPTPLVNGEKFVQRFKRESKAAAKLHHTNIVSVFGVGEQDGLHYYVMDFVDGESLDGIIFGLNQKSASTGLAASTKVLSDTDANRESPDFDVSSKNASTSLGGNDTSSSMSTGSLSQWSLPRSTQSKHFRWSARLGTHIADALDYAHHAKILHRDVKPSNIILDRKGIVWITDFGLVKDVTEEFNLTKTGDVIGTPQYLAPESLEGKYDHRSETYCLGLTLYELVTFQPAYRPGSPGEVIRAIATSKPPAPRKINPRVPIDLSTIIEKAISRDPDNRYQTAGDLRDDLMAFVEDRPIAARRLFFVEKAARWSRRNPLVAALSAVSLMLLILVAVSASIGYLTTTAALDKEAEKSSRLEIEKLATERAYRIAENNFDQMKAQYDRAESNIALTMEAFDQMFKQIIARGSASPDEMNMEGFREVSGIETSITREDAEFLEQLLQFYEKFTSLNADNENLMAESAKAFRRVGNIYRVVGEMDPAIEAYEESVERYQAMLDSNPDSKEQLLNLVRTQNELSVARRKNGNNLLAHDWNRKSQKLLEESPYLESDTDVRLELVRTLSVMGFNLYRISTMDDARPNGGGGRNRSRLDEMIRGRGPFQRLKTQAYWNEVFRDGRRGMDHRNKELIKRAVQIIDKLVDEQPENLEFLSAQASCYSIMAAARIPVDREAGLRMRDKAIKSCERLVESNPNNNAEFRYLLALACTVGTTPPQREDADLVRRALKITEELTTQFPTMLDYHHLHANLCIKIAGSMTRQGKLDGAVEKLANAYDSINVLLDFTPTDRSFLATVRLLQDLGPKLSKQLDAAGKQEQLDTVAVIQQQMRKRLRSEVWTKFRKREPDPAHPPKNRRPKPKKGQT